MELGVRGAEGEGGNLRNQSGCSSIWETNIDLLARTWLSNPHPNPSPAPSPSFPGLCFVVITGGMRRPDSLPEPESLFLS